MTHKKRIVSKDPPFYTTTSVYLANRGVRKEALDFLVLCGFPAAKDTTRLYDLRKARRKFRKQFPFLRFSDIDGLLADNVGRMIWGVFCYMVLFWTITYITESGWRDANLPKVPMLEDLRLLTDVVIDGVVVKEEDSQGFQIKIIPALAATGAPAAVAPAPGAPDTGLPATGDPAAGAHAIPGVLATGAHAIPGAHFPALGHPPATAYHEIKMYIKPNFIYENEKRNTVVVAPIREDVQDQPNVNAAIEVPQYCNPCNLCGQGLPLGPQKEGETSLFGGTHQCKDLTGGICRALILGELEEKALLDVASKDVWSEMNLTTIKQLAITGGENHEHRLMLLKMLNLLTTHVLDRSFTAQHVKVFNCLVRLRLARDRSDVSGTDVDGVEPKRVLDSLVGDRPDMELFRWLCDIALNSTANSMKTFIYTLGYPKAAFKGHNAGIYSLLLVTFTLECYIKPKNVQIQHMLERQLVVARYSKEELIALCLKNEVAFENNDSEYTLRKNYQEYLDDPDQAAIKYREQKARQLADAERLQYQPYQDPKEGNKIKVIIPREESVLWFGGLLGDEEVNTLYDFSSLRMEILVLFYTGLWRYIIPLHVVGQGKVVDIVLIARFVWVHMKSEKYRVKVLAHRTEYLLGAHCQSASLQDYITGPLKDLLDKAGNNPTERLVKSGDTEIVSHDEKAGYLDPRVSNLLSLNIGDLHSEMASQTSIFQRFDSAGLDKLWSIICSDPNLHYKQQKRRSKDYKLRATAGGIGGKLVLDILERNIIEVRRI